MSRPLRIACFVGCFPVVSETFIVRQIAGLLELGHDVRIFSDTRAEPGSPEPPEVTKHRLLERTTFMNLPPETVPCEMPVWPVTGKTWSPGATTPVANWRRVWRALPALIRCWRTSPRLTVQLLRRSEYSYRAASLSGVHRCAKLAVLPQRFDVLHAHFGPNGNSYRFTRELWRAPLVVSFHGYDVGTVPRREGPAVYQRLFASVDRVTVNSAFTRSRIEHLGCPPGKIRLLPLGLDLSRFAFRERSLAPDGRVRILNVARLVPVKGHEFLIRALARVRESYPNVACDIVGDGPERERLAALIEQLGLRAVVRLHGAQTGDALMRLFDGAHLAALTSVTVDGAAEGQGLFLQEAQACGLPVLATTHGALPEGMLPGQSGLLAPERDAEALADQLRQLLSHPERWPEMGRAGRDFISSQYDIRRLTARCLEIYQELLPHA